MPIKNNSAKYLLAILNQLKQGQANERTQDAIKRIFSVNDNAKVGIHIGEIYTLANDVFKKIASIPDHVPEIHLKWSEGVYRGLSTLSVNGTINGFKEAYTDAVRAYLESAAVELGRHYPELDINSETLNELYTNISPMIESLLADDTIETGLRNFIVEKLTTIQDVIAHATLVGYNNLSPAVESAFAGTIFRVGVGAGFQELKDTSSAFAQYVDWIGRFLVLLEASSIGYKAIGSVSKLLSN